MPALLQGLFSPKRGHGSSSDRKVMHLLSGTVSFSNMISTCADSTSTVCNPLWQPAKNILFFDQYGGGRECVGVLVDEFVSLHSWLLVSWSRLLSSSFTERWQFEFFWYKCSRGVKSDLAAGCCHVESQSHLHVLWISAPFFFSVYLQVYLQFFFFFSNL